MADNIKVEPSPIQRNQRDVATELTQLYFSKQHHSECTIENVKKAYLEFYSMVETVEYVPYEKSFNPTVEKLGKNILSGE